MKPAEPAPDKIDPLEALAAENLRLRAEIEELRALVPAGAQPPSRSLVKVQQDYIASQMKK